MVRSFFKRTHREFNGGKNSFPTKGFGTIAMGFISLKDKQTIIFRSFNFLFFNWKKVMQYIMIKLFPSSFPFQTLLTSPPTQLHALLFSFSLNKTSKQASKQKQPIKQAKCTRILSVCLPALNTTREGLIPLTVFVPWFHQCFLQADHHCRSQVCGWVGV